MHLLTQNISMSSYKKTPLPVRLELKDLDTKSQLEKGAQLCNHQSVTNQPELNKERKFMKELNKDSRKVIEDHLDAFLKGQGSNFRLWVRDFHSEYDEQWFLRNWPRLEIAFKPIWESVIKSSHDHTDLLSFDLISKNPVEANDLSFLFPNYQENYKKKNPQTNLTRLPNSSTDDLISL